MKILIKSKMSYWTQRAKQIKNWYKNHFDSFPRTINLDLLSMLAFSLGLSYLPSALNL